jgi:hypothetical protein
VLGVLIALAALAAPALAQEEIGPAPPAVPVQPGSPEATPAPGEAPPASASPGRPVTPAPPAPSWQAGRMAKLVVIEKLATQPTTLTIPVGQSSTFESLSIAVRDCMVRPPTEPPDATAFLDITDSHAGAPDFHGWVFASEPEVSMFQSPVYDVLLTGCG